MENILERSKITFAPPDWLSKVQCLSYEEVVLRNLFTTRIVLKTTEFVSFISRYADVSGAITLKLKCEGERRNEAAGRSDAWGCRGSHRGWPTYLTLQICYYSHDKSCLQ